MDDIIPDVTSKYHIYKNELELDVAMVSDKPQFQNVPSLESSIKNMLHAEIDDYIHYYKDQLDEAFLKYTMMQYIDENHADQRTRDAQTEVFNLTQKYKIAKDAKLYIKKYF